MKSVLFLLLLLVFGVTMYSQVPQGIPYQAVARDNQGSPISNQSVTIQFSLHEASADGQVIFRETHNTTTNAQGLFSLTFGSGVATVGSFANINWGSGYKFLQVEADFGSGYVDLGTQQLMAVPYALYSGSSGNSANNQNSNYYPSSDSVLTLVGKMILPNGIYTVPEGEVWEIEALNATANGVIQMNLVACELTGYLTLRCAYSAPANFSPIVFALNEWAFNHNYGTQSNRFISLTQEQLDQFYPNYCELCTNSISQEYGGFLGSAIVYPLYAVSGDIITLNGVQASVSKYR
jgi:hypothetical protein